MKAINIIWDTTDNGEELVDIPSLPTEVEIPKIGVGKCSVCENINCEVNQESIATWLSDKYGWLVSSFKIIN